MRPSASRAALVLLLLSVGSGCGRVRRARECAALAAQVNPALTAIERAHRESRYDRAAWDDASLSFSALAGAVRARAFSDSEMKATVAAFAQHLDETSKAARSMATALESGSAVKVATARREVELAVKAERGLVSRLDEACAAP